MTLADVQDRLKKIEEISGDFETAHCEEDNLRGDVLRAIASGNCTADAACLLAREALKTNDIEFTRWYA